MISNPMITQKKLQEETLLGMTSLKRAIAYLTTMGIVSKGNGGSKKGWTINSPFSVDESYIY